MRSWLDRARRSHGGAIAVIIAIAFAAVFAGVGHADNDLPDPGWVVTTAPTTNLVDGQVVSINVKSRADVAINQIEIRECRFGVTYATVADVDPDKGNCPSRPVSTSADYFVTRSASGGLAFLARTADGASVPFLIGAGVVEWDNALGKSTLSCDPSDPCALVVKVSTASATSFQTFKLNFADPNPLAGCGGAAEGALNTQGSDEVSDAWVAWTKADCALTGKRAPTLASFTDERGAVDQFAQGTLDLAYTGAGYDPKIGVVDIPAAQRRAAVAIPVALNASVIASGGGQHQLVNGIPLGDKVRYPDGSLKLKASEVGALLGGGQQRINRIDLPYGNDILTRNPVLQNVLYAPDAGVYAPSQTLSSTYFMTSYLASLAPADFVDPTVVPAAVHVAGPSLGLAHPQYNLINTYSARPNLQKVMFPAAISASDGPVWAMTDLASAKALGLTPVALQSGGDFVAPTPASLTAAVAAMKPDADGLLIADPGAAARATTSAGATKPYPLTYVIYALVPAQPLVDQSTCTARTASQALLAQWLQYVTGAGQKNLPAGMEPLTPALAAQAKLTLAKVGATPVTGKCARAVVVKPGSTTTTTTPSGDASTTTTTIPVPGSITPPPSSSGFSGSSGSGGSRGSTSVGPPSTVITVPATGKVGPVGATKAQVTAVKIPPFGGHRTAGALDGVVALLGIALITSLAAWITAGGEAGTPAFAAGFDARRVASLCALWAAVGFTAVALVLFQLGPMLQQRDQRALLASYRVTIDHVAAEADTPAGLQGEPALTTAPQLGAPVGIVEIGALKTQDVVVEGVQASDTRRGPGHVPGTAGLGQPGNSVIVARRNAYGGTFAHIGSLHKGDPITVTTTQGQSVYEVERIEHVKIDTSAAPADTPANIAAGGGKSAVGRGNAVRSQSAQVSVDDVYGPSADDRLTLITSGSRAPWSSSSATEVVAKLRDKPYPATLQGLRSNTETGLHGDGGVWPAVVLVLLAFVAALAGAVALYRRMRFRTAYVLTIAPLVALTVLTGETVVRLLPAWT